MVEFSSQDWLIGLSTISIVICGYIIGLVFLYKSRKQRIRLLTIYSLTFIFAATAWLPIVIEFISVLLTGNSINKVFFVYLMWLPTPIAAALMFYIALEFLTPIKKWYFLIPFLVLTGLVTLGIILDPLGFVIFIEPPLTGFIHNAGLDPAGISSFLAFVIFLIILVFAGLGYLRKAFISEDVIRKKFIFLSISIVFFIGFGMIDNLVTGIALVLVRIGAMSNFIFAYLALRTEPEKTKEKTPKEEVKIKESLFRLTKRPDNITEEDVIFHREKKICLVCKGDVSRINYVCPKCSALYCIKCSEELTKLENVCWVCNEPLDPSIPSKPYKKEEEEVEIDKSEEIQKKS